jgi:hypothetical protein
MITSPRRNEYHDSRQASHQVLRPGHTSPPKSAFAAGRRAGGMWVCLSLSFFLLFWIDGGRCRRDGWRRKQRVSMSPGCTFVAPVPRETTPSVPEGTSDAAQPVSSWRAYHHLDSPTRRLRTAWGDPGRCLLPLASQRARGGTIAPWLTQDCHSDPSDLNTYRGLARKCAKKTNFVFSPRSGHVTHGWSDAIKLGQAR